MSKSKKQEQCNSSCSRAKAEGAFIALAAGDALGWPQEFRRKVIRPKEVPVSKGFHEWVRRGGGRFYPYEEIIGAGEYSDDTQLTMAVARCRLIAGSAWWDALTQTEIPLWTLYERGGGGATKRAAGCWIRGTPPWQGRAKSNVRRYFEAGGNGVAMRVISHAVFFAGEENARGLIRDVVLDGVATHGHPRALVGASAYAFAAWWLLRSTQTVAFGELVDVLLDEAKVWGTLPAEKDLKDGWLDAANNVFRGDYDKVWQETVSEMCQLLDRVRSGLQEGAIANDDAVLKGLGAFGSSKGSGTIGAAAALYLVARYAAQPNQAVLKAAFARDADTDTIAAMAGGLAGCLSGTDWLPREWLKVQDCDYLRDLANMVAQGPSAAVERPPSHQALRATQLEAVRTALAASQEGEFDIDGVRKARILKSGEPVALSKSTKVHTWLLCVEDGQTLYITKVGRRPKDDPATEVRAVTRTNEGKGDGSAVVGVKLSVSDLARAESFYQKAFGLVPTRHTRDSVSFGGLSLEELQHVLELSGAAATDNTGTPRSMIVIRVSNLKDVLKQVEPAGGRIVHGIKTPHREQRFFHCFDLDSNLLEVVESVPARNTERDSTVTVAAMGNKDEKAHQFGGGWTSKKLEVIAGYLGSYTKALKNKPFKKGYIDGFAGSGYRKLGSKGLSQPLRESLLFPDLAETEPQGLLDGSASFALKTEPRFDSYIFIEQNAKRRTSLKKLKRKFPSLAKDISIRGEDANTEIKELCNKNWGSHRAVLFLDPYGMQVDWTTVEVVAKTESIDLWVLFPLGIAVNRLLKTSGDIPKSWRERLNRLFGTEDWYDKFYDKQTTTDLFVGERECVVKAPMEAVGRYYNDRLRGIFAGVVDEPRVLRDSSKNPLYLLCFAVGNEKGKPTALPIAQHMLKGMQ